MAAKGPEGEAPARKQRDGHDFVESLVTVGIYGVAGLIFGQGSQDLPSPRISVTAFHEVRKTHKEANVRECTFNYDFVWDKRCKVEELMAGDVLVEVYHSSWTGDELLGRVTFSNQVVYSQTHPDHMIPRGWFPVASAQNPAETKGFVDMSVGVFIAGDRVGRTAYHEGISTDDQTDLKSRVVKMPDPAALNLFQLTVRIHAARSLMTVAGLVSEGCDPFVAVEFNGVTQRTKTIAGATAPSWNEELNFPFMHPCWDNSFQITVYSDGGVAHTNTKLGKITMCIDDVHHEMPPNWFFFYTAPLGSVLADGATQHQRPSVFAGRLLMSVKVERMRLPLLGITPARSVAEPVTHLHILRVDVSKIAFDMPDNSPDLPSEVYISIEMGSCRMMQPIASEPASRVGPAPVFIWNPPEAGVLPETEVSFPSLEHMPDPNSRLCLIASVFVASSSSWTGASDTRHMFCMIPVADVLNWNTTDKWYNMYRVGDSIDSLAAGIVLMNVNVGPKKGAPARRQTQKVFQSATYYFRARIYQATNLPPAMTRAFPDPFVVIELGTTRLMTGAKAQEMCPEWYEVVEAKVKLPTDEMQRPDVHVFIFDRDEDRIDLIAKMAYSTRKEGALPEKWVGPPIWHDLSPKPGAAPTHAKLLACFELIPEAKFQHKDSIWPSMQDCRVELYLLGVRFKKRPDTVAKPVVVASWSHGHNTVEKASHVGVGAQGQFNFMKKLVLEPCSLSKEPIFQDWLHIRVIDFAAEGDDLEPIAHATLHLTPLLPWLAPSTQKRMEQHFKEQRLSLLRAGVKETIESDEELHDVFNECLESTTSDLHDRVKKLKPRKHRRAKKMTHTDAGTAPVPDVKPARQPEEPAPASWTATNIEASNAQTMEEREYKHRVGRPLKMELEDDFFQDMITKFTEFFDWPLHTGEDQTLASHPDLTVELENTAHLKPEKLPYTCTPLFIEGENGVRLEAGVLKYRLRVVDLRRVGKGSKSQQEEDMRWEDDWNKLKKDMDMCRNLRVRAYMLSADGLVPKSGNRDCSTFLWLMAGLSEKDSQHYHSVCDSENLCAGTMNPEFNRCYTFDNIEFPHNAFMRLAVMEGSDNNTLIGATMLDIEDRWFQQKYRSMVENDSVPIETRVLYEGDSVFSKGHLRMWIEVFTDELLARRPEPTTLPNMDSALFQLRVVIWKTHQVTYEDYSGEEKKPNLYVTGQFKLNDDNLLTETTHTHHGARDGNATFNHRMLFDIEVPSKHPVLHLQVWHWDILGSSEICNVKLDLSSDFKRAQHQRSVYDLPRGKVPLTNPAFHGKTRGFLELEAALWPMEESKIREAGRGQDPPNEEPFCDPNDLHLLEGRQSFGGFDLIKGIENMGQRAFTAAKWSAALYVMLYAVGFLASCVTTLIVFCSVVSCDGDR